MSDGTDVTLTEVELDHVVVFNPTKRAAKIEVQARTEGRFTEAAEKILAPGQYAQVYLADGMSFQFAFAKDSE